MNILRQFACLAVMAAIGFLSASTPAHAGMVLVLTDGTTTDTIPGTGGVASFNGALGIFNINVTTGISKPVLGSLPGDAAMDLFSVNVSTNGPSSGTATLVIKLTDTDFPTPPGSGILTNAVGGTLSGGTATAQAWMDPLNQEFGMGAGTFTPGSQSLIPSPVAFASEASVGDNVTAPYSMTIQLTLTATGGQFNFSADDRLDNIVPEPSTVALALTGVPFLAVVALRRRKKSRA